MKKRVALITWAGLPRGAESEQLLLPHLAAEGVRAEFVDWRDATCDYTRFDLLLLRSCWDYHLHRDEFVAWLARVNAAVPVLNRLETVLWNLNKFYLRELKAQGLEIAPTVFVNGQCSIDPAAWRQIKSWERSVVKPAVSASAYKTWLFARAALPDIDELNTKMNGEAFIVQQFILKSQQAEKSHSSILMARIAMLCSSVRWLATFACRRSMAAARSHSQPRLLFWSKPTQSRQKCRRYVIRFIAGWTQWPEMTSLC